MITAIVRVDVVTRATSSPDAFGSTRTTFQVWEGTPTWPLATVVVTPPLERVPPLPEPPAII